MKDDGDPNWEEEYRKDMAKKEADPTASVLIGLESFGLKPLFHLFTEDEQKAISWIPKKKGQFVRTWDRDMFQQAIERMLSWESWNRRVADERTKLQEKVDKFYEQHLAEEADWYQELRNFEIERDKKLSENAFAPNESYKITSRQIRGWDRVFSRWSRLPDNASQEEYWKEVAIVQKDLAGGFGDPVVFQFLSDSANHWIWRENAKRIGYFAAYNGLVNRLNRSKEQATFTLPDPVKHPLWIRYDARGGNLHQYTLTKVDRKHLQVKFDRMIWPSETGEWVEIEDIAVQVAPSKQFNQQIEVQDNTSGKQQVDFSDYSSGFPLQGVLGGAKIQFEREHLVKRKQTVAAGDVGSVYLNVVVDVEPLQEIKNGRLRSELGQSFRVVPADWPKVIDFKPEELSEWIKNKIPTASQGIESIKTGMRVMSIDMGQRASAAVSIFEVVDKSPNDESKKLFFEIRNTDLFAVHRRSLLLNLPGEKVDRDIVEERKDRWDIRVRIRAQVRMLSRVLSLNRFDNAKDREKAIQEMLEGIQQWTTDFKEVWRKEIDGLTKVLNEDKDSWKQTVMESHRRLEPLVGQEVSKWRKELSKYRKGIAGLSMWNLEELEDTRKLLVSWSKRSRTPGEVNRINRDEPFGAHQLAHIQNVKDDRLKQMANFIVMTALGYVYDENRKQWIAKYPACQLILFEDLSRYRFNQDRPRRENSKLMKWAHRSIPKMVYMQGELYGLQVGDVYSAYSSKFHARTGAPGIRCHAINELDLQGKTNVIKTLVTKEFLNENQVSELRVGDIVPYDGGELFTTLSKPYSSYTKELTFIHADINAAQNLQKRFWQQKSEIFRVPCQRVTSGDEEFYIPKSDSMKKYLGKGRFIKIKEEVYKWDNSTKLKIKTTSTQEGSDLEDLQEFELELEAAQELQGEFVTFFRDPSGYFFNPDQWIPQVKFHSIVRKVIESRLKDLVLNREQKQVEV